MCGFLKTWRLNEIEKIISKRVVVVVFDNGNATDVC